MRITTQCLLDTLAELGQNPVECIDGMCVRCQIMTALFELPHLHRAILSRKFMEGNQDEMVVILGNLIHLGYQIAKKEMNDSLHPIDSVH